MNKECGDKFIHIGKVGDSNVVIAPWSANEHILICGISGSGKSVRLNEIEQKIVKNGGTVLAIDLNGTHEEVSDSICNQICIQRDGLDLRILDETLVIAGKETEAVSYATEILASNQHFGARQQNALRHAIAAAVEKINDCTSQMEAIYRELSKGQTSYMEAVLDRIWPVFEGDFFRKNGKSIQKNKINILSFEGIAHTTQIYLVEIILSVLWRQRRNLKNNISRLTITLDELQNFSLGENSTMAKLLVESRKYNIQLVMATQTLSRFNKSQLSLLNQASVKLFFRPAQSDLMAISKMFERGKEAYWERVLDKLQIGQAVVLGDCLVQPANRRLNRPIFTRSEYGDLTL